MSINLNLIGLRIRDYRYRKKITQAELAEKADISVPYMSRIETGSKEVSRLAHDEKSFHDKIGPGDRILTDCIIAQSGEKCKRDYFRTYSSGVLSVPLNTSMTFFPSLESAKSRKKRPRSFLSFAGIRFQI